MATDELGIPVLIDGAWLPSDFIPRVPQGMTPAEWEGLYFPAVQYTPWLIACLESPIIDKWESDSVDNLLKQNEAYWEVLALRREQFSTKKNAELS